MPSIRLRAHSRMQCGKPTELGWKGLSMVARKTGDISRISFTRSTVSIHFYGSIVVFEKGPSLQPISIKHGVSVYETSEVVLVSRYKVA